MTDIDSHEFAKRARIEVAKVLNRTNDSHIGGGYSSMDILAVLYTRILNIDKNNLDDPNRDVFILSKGHIAASYYTVLALAGIIPAEDLDKHIVNGSIYAGHTRKSSTKGVAGVEMSAGSLGHGANMGAGMAYAKKIRGLGGRVFVLMGDGECNEGSVWEAAMFASRFNLSNLVMVVDHNHLQAYGSDKQVLDMGDLVAKFREFGCDAIGIDGHDHSQIYEALSLKLGVGKSCHSNTGESSVVSLNDMTSHSEKPLVVVAETIKGKGASFMENKLEWHFKSPNDEQLAQIIREQEALAVGGNTV